MNGRCQQIIALGGGGFSDSRDPGLDEYLLQQARVPRPTVCFVGAASGDADSYLAKFYAAFSRYECRPCHLPLFRRTPDLSAYVRAQDVIFVGGGNTRSMLAVWREWGLPELLREAYETGTVAARPKASAYRIELTAGVVSESALQAERIQLDDRTYGSGLPDRGHSERGSPFLNDTLPRSSLIGAARKQPQGSSLGRHT